MPQRVFSTLFLVLVACEPLDPARGDAGDRTPDAYTILVADPLVLDFGALSVNEAGVAVQSSSLENHGTETMPLRGHDLAIATAGSPEAFSIQTDESVIELAPDESINLQVVFTPFTEADYVASILIYDGSEDDPQLREEVEIRLAGTGLAPVVEVRDTAASVVAGVGCSAEQHIQVKNLGSEDLIIEDAVVRESLDLSILSASSDPIEPGRSGELIVSFEPTWQGYGEADRSALLQLETNDPATPVSQITLPAIAFEGSSVTEETVYGTGAESDWLLLADASLETTTTPLAELMGTTLSELHAAGVHVNLAALGGGLTCPGTVPAFETNDEGGTRAEGLVAGLSSTDGDNYRLLEQALDVMDQTSAGGCLEDWRRDSRQLHVVLVSRTDSTSSATASDLLDALQDAAGGDVVISVVGATGDVPCSGWDEPTSYLQASDDSDGVSVDLCREDWSASTSLLASPSSSLLDDTFVWFLTEQPLAETLELQADGITYEQDEGWSYDADRNAVIVDERLGLSAGADLTLRYMAALEC